MDMQIQRPMARRVNVGSKERGVSMATGLAMLAYLLRRRPDPRMGIPLGLEAGYMLYRGATGHCVVYGLMDINRADDGDKGIQVQRSITVNKPRDELFRIWRNAENLPRFMEHLKSVRIMSEDGKQSHWVAKAPLGREIEWDSVITDEVENEYLAWHALPGSIVESIGSVRFTDAPGGRGTVVNVSMQYHPPAGSMGAAFAKLFGEEPGQQIRDDLRHFKQIMETGEIPSVEGQTSGRNHEFERSMAEREQEKDLVEEASDQSFPASDPPGWVSRKRPKRSYE